MTHRLLAIALLSFAAACQRTPAKSGTSAAGAPATVTKPAQTAGGSPAAAQGSGQVAAPIVKPVPTQLPDLLARVNGRAVNKAEFERAIKNVEARAGGPVPADRRDEVYREVLDQLIAFHLLEQEVATRKIAVTDAEVEARLKEIRGQFPDEAAFQKALREQQLTIENLRGETRGQMQVGKLVEAEVGAKVNVQPQQVSDFYARNPERFKQAESIRAAHILVRMPDKPDETSKKKARAEAETLLKQIKAGTDFAKLAKERSQDPSTAANGGELPVFPRGQMPPAFEEAAFALQPGQMSGVVETPFGYHIIKVLERRPPTILPLAEVQSQITEYLANEQRQQKMAAFIERLKAKGKVEVFI